jgi:HSP20 family molecular chaperone IbpA
MKFTVRDAGDVEIEREGDRLTLVEARPNEGWDIEDEYVVYDEVEVAEDGDSDEDDVDESDEAGIEVTFTQGDREIEFEAEIIDGRLSIEIEETLRGVEPGSFQVGEAGDVEVRLDGDQLTLVGVIANEGWDFEAEHEDDDAGDEIEVTFTSGDRSAEFEATIVDGVLEIEIEMKWVVDEE